jgi:hypothetical protein
MELNPLFESYGSVSLEELWALLPEPKDYRVPLMDFVKFRGWTLRDDARKEKSFISQATVYEQVYAYKGAKVQDALFISYHSNEGSREPFPRIVVLVDGEYSESWYHLGPNDFVERPQYGVKPSSV